MIDFLKDVAGNCVIIIIGVVAFAALCASLFGLVWSLGRVIKNPSDFWWVIPAWIIGVATFIAIKDRYL